MERLIVQRVADLTVEVILCAFVVSHHAYGVLVGMIVDPAVGAQLDVVRLPPSVTVVFGVYSNRLSVIVSELGALRSLLATNPSFLPMLLCCQERSSFEVKSLSPQQ